MNFVDNVDSAVSPLTRTPPMAIVVLIRVAFAHVL